MKHIALILISFLFLTGVSEGKEVSSLQDRNGVRYEVNSEISFTGKLVEKYWNGQKEYEGNFKDGKRDGLSTKWYANGQKGYEGSYKGGKKDGFYNNWYWTGQKK